MAQASSEVISDLRGTTLFCHGGYVYSKKKTTSNRLRWRCSKRMKLQCPGSVSTTKEYPHLYPSSFIPHSHPPDESEKDMRKFKINLAEASLTIAGKPVDVLNSTLQSTTDAVKANIGNVASLKRQIRRQRTLLRTTPAKNPIAQQPNPELRILTGGNPDLVGLSPDVLNSRKKICEDHFRSQDLLPSGRLLIGAVPIPYAPETETKEPLPLKDVSTGINAENSHLKATRTSSSSLQGKRKRKVKKAEDLPSTSTHTDSDVQHLQEYHDETPIDERQVELPVIKQEELMLEDYEGPMEEPYEQCDPVENSDVPSNVEPIPKVKEEIIATPFETVYFQEGPIKIKQEVVEQDIFDKTEDTNIYDPSTSSQAVDSFVKLDANKEKLPTTEIPSTMGPKSNRKNSKGHKGPIFLGCEHCLNEFFSSEEDFLEHCRTKHKDVPVPGTSGSRAKRPRVSRSSDPPSKKPSHQHIKDDDPLDGFFVSLKKVQVENRNATRKKVLELVSLISKQKIDPSLVTFSVQSLPSQLV